MNAPFAAAGMDQGLANGQLHGVLRIDGIYVALPIAHIREVVPRPETLCSMPATVPELLGSIELRGALVPIIDLGRMMRGDGRAPDAAESTIITVLRVPGGVIGVPVQEICGVVDLSCDLKTSLSCHSGTLVSGLTHGGFSTEACQGVILNADALAAIPGMIVAEDRLVAEAGTLSNGVPTLVFAVEANRFGLAAEVIEATVPRRPVHASPVDSPLWIGKIEHNGMLVPLVDTLRLLGLGACTRARETASIVIRIGDNARVALQIDGVLDMARIRPEQCLPFTDFSLDAAGLIAGLHRADHTILMLEPDRLRSHPALCDLSGLEETGFEIASPGLRTSDKLSGPSMGRQPYLIFSLRDDHHAVPLDQVSEILDVESLQMVDLSDAETSIVGMIAHRGAAVPVLDLAARLSLPGEAASRFVLVAEDSGRFTGFFLEQLRAVERHQPRDLGPVGTGSDGQPVSRSVIVTNEGLTCMVMDLREYMPFQRAIVQHPADDPIEDVPEEPSEPATGEAQVMPEAALAEAMLDG